MINACCKLIYCTDKCKSTVIGFTVTDKDRICYSLISLQYHKIQELYTNRDNNNVCQYIAITNILDVFGITHYAERKAIIK